MLKIILLPLCPFAASLLLLKHIVAGLVYECLKPCCAVCILLPIISHIKAGNIVILLPESFKDRPDNCTGHTGKWHYIHYAAHALIIKINCLANAQYRLPSKLLCRYGLAKPIV